METEHTCYEDRVQRLEDNAEACADDDDDCVRGTYDICVPGCRDDCSALMGGDDWICATPMTIKVGDPFAAVDGDEPFTCV